MKSDVIYSKIEYADAVSAKRDLLTAQMSILNLIKKIQDYKTLRKKELMLKLKLKNLTKEANSNISKIIKSSPKTPSLREVELSKNEFSTKSEKKKVSGIELELREIREKLDKLG